LTWCRRSAWSTPTTAQGKKICDPGGGIRASKGIETVLTEQHAFLDGYEDGGSRERGTQSLMDNLGVALSGGDTRIPKKSN
jgi:hypothetical protein